MYYFIRYPCLRRLEGEMTQNCQLQNDPNSRIGQDDAVNCLEETLTDIFECQLGIPTEEMPLHRLESFNT